MKEKSEGENQEYVVETAQERIASALKLASLEIEKIGQINHALASVRAYNLIAAAQAELHLLKSLPGQRVVQEQVEKVYFYFFRGIWGEYGSLVKRTHGIGLVYLVVTAPASVFAFVGDLVISLLDAEIETKVKKEVVVPSVDQGFIEENQKSIRRLLSRLLEKTRSHIELPNIVIQHRPYTLRVAAQDVGQLEKIIKEFRFLPGVIFQKESKICPVIRQSDPVVTYLDSVARSHIESCLDIMTFESAWQEYLSHTLKSYDSETPGGWVDPKSYGVEYEKKEISKNLFEFKITAFARAWVSRETLDFLRQHHIQDPAGKVQGDTIKFLP